MLVTTILILRHGRVRCWESNEDVVQFNTSPHDKFYISLSQTTACSDNKINKTRKFRFVLGKLENIVRKKGKWSFVEFPQFATMFSNDFLVVVIKS